MIRIAFVQAVKFNPEIVEEEGKDAIKVFGITISERQRKEYRNASVTVFLINSEPLELRFKKQEDAENVYKKLLETDANQYIEITDNTRWINRFED